MKKLLSVLCGTAIAGFALAGENWARPELVEQVKSGRLASADVSWWGTDPVDSLRYVRAAIDSGANTVRLDRAQSVWTVGATVWCRSNLTLVVPEGVTLLAKKGAFHGTGEALVQATFCTNVVICGGGELKMQFEDYTNRAIYAHSQWRHGVAISSCRNVRLEDLRIVDTGGDGVYVSEMKCGFPSTDIVLRNLLCHRNNRQGVSVISVVRMLMENVIMEDTCGTLPMAGIDFEPNVWYNRLDDIVLRNCVSRRNLGNGFDFSVFPIDRMTITLENCRSEGNAKGVYFAPAVNLAHEIRGWVRLKGCTFDDQGTKLDAFRRLPADEERAYALEISDCTVRDASSGRMIAMPSDCGWQAAEQIRYPDGEVCSPVPWTEAMLAKATVQDSCPDREVELTKMNGRGTVAYIFYAAHAGEVRLGAFYQQLGRGGVRPVNADVMTLRGDGVVKLPTLTAFGPTNWVFSVPKPGFYRLQAGAGSHGFYLTRSSVPVAYSSQASGQACGLNGIPATGYVRIAPGTPRIALGGCGQWDKERLHLRIFDPAGNCVWDRNDVGSAQYFRALNPEAGLWRVEATRPSKGYMDDYHLDILGAPVFFFLSPEKTWSVPPVSGGPVAEPGRISLAGRWQVSGDGIAGVAELPGTLAQAGLGRRWTERDFQTTMDLPQSEALVQEFQYVGKAVWTRTIELTPQDCAQPKELLLERVMWKSAATLDGHPLGSCDSLATPHVYPIPGELLTPGRHVLQLAIDNSCFYGFSRQSHAYGPNMQAIWNGVLGELALRDAHPLRTARLFASADGALAVEVPESLPLARMRIAIEGLSVTGLTERPSPYRRGYRLIAVAHSGAFVPWSDMHPRLYTAELRDVQTGFVRRIRFGFHTYAVAGRAITLNGARMFQRGNVENANFAKDGVPWMKPDEWLKVFRMLKDEDGVNTVRFHSWCPPRAAFDAAETAGVMLAPEAGIWTDGWMSDGDELGNGKPVDDFVRRELRAISETYGDSPAFLSLAIGNELGNSNFATMGEWIREAKTRDPRMLWYASSARQITAADDMSLSHVVPGKGLAREKLLPRTDWDYEAIYSASAVPTVAHEIGQWPVYPIWDELLNPFTGTMRPWNLSRHYDTAVRKNALRFQRQYHEASARLNRVIYKEEVESFLRTPSCAGLQLLEVQDYTGQAEALVGWRDPFYALKPGFRDLRPFSTVWGPICYLARMPRFTYRAGETFRATLQIRNLTGEALAAGRKFAYSLGGTKGELKLSVPVAPGALVTVGEVTLKLTEAMTRAKQTLAFGTNEWNFWVYPQESAMPVPPGVVMTKDPAELKSAIARGETVLYTGSSCHSAKGRFKSVYWSARWFAIANTIGAALGTWFDVKHPALRGFVTEAFTDWQWYSLSEGATIHALKEVPGTFRPIALSVNDFHFSDFASPLFEVLVGQGRLLVCGYDLDQDTPEARRLRACILDYLKQPPAAGTVRLDESWLAVQFDAPGDPVPTEAVYDERPQWQGRTFRKTIQGVPPTTGKVIIDFSQPGKSLTSGRGLLEGRVFEVPFMHQKGDAVTVSLMVNREDFLDGKLELEINLMTGSSLGVDRIRVVGE